MKRGRHHSTQSVHLPVWAKDFSLVYTCLFGRRISR
jgi:hypothetical protein